MPSFCLVPLPYSVQYQSGEFLYPPAELSVVLPLGLTALKEPLHTVWPELSHASSGSIAFIQNHSISRESYRLTVSTQAITLSYSQPSGAFYGLMTLRQLSLQRLGSLPCCEIADKPGLPIRGVMLDISRGKVPTLETLKMTVDRMAAFKLNHLELYIEGFSFAYPSFQKFWEKGYTPLTQDELHILDDYCKARFIELVPAQNGLGHMADWLDQEEYRSLSELENGRDASGIEMQPTTLNAADPRSLELVTQITDDLLPCFTSPYFNACLDEPFELGKGKNKALADETGADYLYLDYVKKVHAMLSQRGKTMMMWGDIVSHGEELSAALPKDILVLDWGYEAEYEVEKHTAALERSGLRFCVCPGTNSWLTFSGLTDNMTECVRKAAESAYRHKAEGIIITDWGDLGHMQYFAFSWPGIVLSAAYAWNPVGAGEEALAEALSLFLFRDQTKTMGKLLLAAGRYSRLEEFRLPCRTLVYLPLVFGLEHPEDYPEKLQKLVDFLCTFCTPAVAEVYQNSFLSRKEPDLSGILAYLNQLLETTDKSCLKVPDGPLILREIRNALLLVRICTRARSILCGKDDGSGLSQDIDAAVIEHRRLWLARNKLSGLEASLFPIYRLRDQLPK